MPILKHPSKPVSTMIIVQYRPPVEAFCVEFPAGLIDEGESPEQTAVRELREETGYSGKVCSDCPFCYLVCLFFVVGDLSANVKIGR